MRTSCYGRQGPRIGGGGAPDERPRRIDREGSVTRDDRLPDRCDVIAQDVHGVEDVRVMLRGLEQWRPPPVQRRSRGRPRRSVVEECAQASHGCTPSKLDSECEDSGALRCGRSRLGIETRGSRRVIRPPGSPRASRHDRAVSQERRDRARRRARRRRRRRSRSSCPTALAATAACGRPSDGSSDGTRLEPRGAGPVGRDEVGHGERRGVLLERGDRHRRAKGPPSARRLTGREAAVAARRWERDAPPERRGTLARGRLPRARAPGREYRRPSGQPCAACRHGTSAPHAAATELAGTRCASDSDASPPHPPRLPGRYGGAVGRGQVGGRALGAHRLLDGDGAAG